jgi:hypothetical protein
MLKWLRQHSKDFYAAGFNALVKRWDKCINVGGGYVETQMLFSRFKYHMFYILYQFLTYLLTLPPTHADCPRRKGQYSGRSQ